MTKQGPLHRLSGAAFTNATLKGKHFHEVLSAMKPVAYMIVALVAVPAVLALLSLV